ncbi:MAG: hypothetical protein U0H60_11050 [Lachnospiraceae bacterium]|nr:hypothetical protein [Lachnospiraceae bacterium]
MNDDKRTEKNEGGKTEMDNWSEIEYLTEKDLSYFRKKAEKGEAVILEIPPEILRSMDIKSLLEDE